MIHPTRHCVLLFRIDLYDSQLMIISVRLWNWEGSSFTPITLHEQINVSFRCDTDSSNKEGFATAYASAIHFPIHCHPPSDIDTDTIDDSDTVPSCRVPTEAQRFSLFISNGEGYAVVNTDTNTTTFRVHRFCS